MPYECCGAPALLGPCAMPAGHNRGRVDIPENHRAASEGGTATVPVTWLEDALARLDDVTAERDQYQQAADQWYELTEALALDLRVDGVTQDDVKVWRERVRHALWMAYGTGHRHRGCGLSYAGTVARSPFETEQAVTDPEWTEPPRS